MAPDDTPGADDQDALAAEWAAALAESGSAAQPSDDMFDSPGAGTTVQEQVAPAAFNTFTPTSLPSTTNDINMILDIPVQLTVELGRTRIPIKNILQLAQGSVVELDALAGEPMDVLVNGYLIAQGEVVVVNDKFGIRLTDIVTPSERMRRLSKGQ
jgi:flagellar motor switch protein FliN